MSFLTFDNKFRCRTCSHWLSLPLLRLPLLCLSLLCLSLLNWTPPICADEIEQIEKELRTNSVVELEKISESVDQRLESIAQYNLRSGLGAIGYRSQTHPDPDHLEWFEIELESEQNIDEIVLIPNILRDETSGYVGDGFPSKICITLGTGSGATRAKVAQFEVVNHSPQRVAPLVIPTKQSAASWVRLEAKHLPPRRYDDRYIFQFAEVMVFSGQRNIALHQPVKTLTNQPTGSPAWEKSFAVDGYVPYLMNSALGNGTLAFVSGVGIGDEPAITIDLQAELTISRVNLHLVDQSDTVPQTFGGNFGVPGTIKIEGALTADFSDAKLLSQSNYSDIYDCGPIVLLQFEAHSCRYVRVTAVDPFLYDYEDVNKVGTRIGFSEIGIFADQENLAIGKPVTANFEHSEKDLRRITDGNNRYGRIIPIRNWLSELSERHTLEEKRPLIAAELNRRYQNQRQNLKWLIGLAGALGLIAIFSALAGWQLRERAVQKTREQIAADLHDELGANVHAMGLISDMAKASASDPKRLNQLLLRMRDLSERTGKAASNCVNMLESEGLFDDLITDMRRASTRITSDLEHQFNVSGEDNLFLKPKQKFGLFLFYKECLTNALRHSNASRLTTDLTIEKNQILLEVTDNGSGLPNTSPGKAVPTQAIPKSLRRRARLLGGKISAQHLQSGGTAIRLVLV